MENRGNDERDRRDRLRRLLMEAHRTKEDLVVDDLWKQRLMSRIREMEAARSKFAFLPDFAQFVWRLAPVTCVLAVALAVLLARLYVTAEYNGLQLWAHYMEEITVAHIFGT